jgi:hypothetical protein
LAQQVTDPPQKDIPDILPPEQGKHVHLSRAGVFSLLAIIGMLLLLFSGLLTYSVVQTLSDLPTPVARVRPTPRPSPTGRVPEATPTGDVTPTATPVPDTSILVPNNPDPDTLQLADGHYLIYEQDDNLYLVSTTDGTVTQINAPNFVNSQAVPPILTPSGQLIYRGNDNNIDGIWMIDVFSGTPTQIASASDGQVITSMALSDDGQMIAWTTEPQDGNGTIEMYAGPLSNPALVYQQAALDCPCYRIFSFLHGFTKQADTTLLLTDDRGSHEAVQYGLWSLDLSNPQALPQLILDENPSQGPLVMTPYGNALLYSTNEGAVPVPTDKSVPESVAALSYANSLSMASLDSSTMSLGNASVILPEQHDLSNSAQYHWVTTPTFSPDGHTLVYVEFSSDDQEPYDRHSAIYTVQISGSGASLHVGKPQLLATSTHLLVELGPWLNNHILTFYGDKTLYAIDVRTGNFTDVGQTSDYARILGAIGFSGG